jgi:hypothetical protein
VYVIGNTVNNPSVKLWKNNVVQNLTDGTHEAKANSVYVLNNDVYVAGREENVAVVWKNGVSKNLSDETNNAEATSVFVVK